MADARKSCFQECVWNWAEVGTSLLLTDSGDFCLLLSPALPWARTPRGVPHQDLGLFSFRIVAGGVLHSRPGTVLHRASGRGRRAASTGAATWAKPSRPWGVEQGQQAPLVLVLEEPQLFLDGHWRGVCAGHSKKKKCGPFTHSLKQAWARPAPRWGWSADVVGHLQRGAQARSELVSELMGSAPSPLHTSKKVL